MFWGKNNIVSEKKLKKINKKKNLKQYRFGYVVRTMSFFYRVCVDVKGHDLPIIVSNSTYNIS